MLTRRLFVLAALVAPLVVALAAGTISTESLAQTPDKLKVAISQRGFWDSSFLEFAQKEGFLKEANLDVEFFYTEGGGQTLQVVNSGSVDIAMSNGLLGTIGALSKGAPIRVISAQMTGAHELFWYVKADSKIRSLKDANDSNTIAFSAPGSSSNLILLSLLKQAGSKAKPDRHRLGGAAVCVARAAGEKDRDRRARPRGNRVGRPNHPRQYRECRCAQEQARRHDAADPGL
jgi:NitT/TauT family transport system substrate-binding protein